MVSDRGRYCNKGVDSLRRMRVKWPVVGSLESSHIPAQLGEGSVAGTYMAVRQGLQSQARGPQQLDPGTQEAAKVEDIVVLEQVVDWGKRLAVAADGVDGLQGAGLLFRQ